MAESSAPSGFRFRLAGVAITIVPMFWFATVILAYGRMNAPATLAIWVGVVLVSILVHELGHALAAKAYGRTVRIELHALGGTTHHGGDAPTMAQTIVIALAGPAAGIALGGIVYAAMKFAPESVVAQPLAKLAIRDALWVNWGYGLFNLLPILPLDGGQVMQAIVDKISKRKNETVGVAISLALALGLLIGALVWNAPSVLFLIGWLVIMHGKRAQELWLERSDRALGPALDGLGPLLAAGDGVALEAASRTVLAQAKSAANRATAINCLVWSYVYQYRLDDAVDAMARMPTGFAVQEATVKWIAAQRAGGDVEGTKAMARAWVREGKLAAAMALVLGTNHAALEDSLLATVAEALFVAKRYRDCALVSERRVAEWKAPSGAYNVACALVADGDRDGAMRWLERACELGDHDADGLLDDDDLASLRDMPRFAALVERMRAASPLTAT